MMQSTSIAPRLLPIPIPIAIVSSSSPPRRLFLSVKPTTTTSSLSITSSPSCTTDSSPSTSSSSSSSNHRPSFLNKLDLQQESNMWWWPDIKAAIGQRINVEGLVCAVDVICRHRHLAMPHLSLPDLRFVDWDELKRNGFQGVVFDKDNTITAPYSLSLWPPLASSLESCKSVFGHNNLAVFSNSAGLREYDGDGRKARILEAAIGIRVIRHRVKKPAGTAEEIEEHFGCESSKLIMVGDRPFTDIVYGNRNGFLTILTEPFSLTDEPFIVKQVRKLEVALVNRWSRKGCRSNAHVLVRDPTQCVKNDAHI